MRQSLSFWIIVTIMGSFFLMGAGCEREEVDVPDAGADWGYVYAVINANCSCHLSEEGEAGLSMIDIDTAYASLVGVASEELSSMNRVTAGDPDNSYLLHKVEGTHDDVSGSGARMPFGCTGGGCLSDEEISNIREWISNGASEEVTSGDDDADTGDDDTGDDDTGADDTGDDDTGDDDTGDDDDSGDDDDDDDSGDDDSSGDDDDDDDDTPDPNAWTFTEVYTVISNNCSCHVNGGASGSQALGSTAADMYAAWVDVDAARAGISLKRIDPGNSDASFVMQKLDGTQGGSGGSQMPLGGSALSQSDRDGIRSWIDAGALNN